MSNKIYDITRTVSRDIATWPGDSSYQINQVVSRAEGSSVNIVQITMSPHTGTHADAHFHYDDDGIFAHELKLERYVGPARIVSIDRKEGGIVPSDFEGKDIDGVERLIIHTWYSDIPENEFDTSFPYPTPEFVDWIAEKGVKLLVVDMPSVDRFDDDKIVSHRQLFKHDINIIELVKLQGIADGDYELIALPLKINHACGTPIRAILRDLD